MSDTYRRYGAIKRALLQFYHPHPSGHQERHLNTLVALICGLVGGFHAALPSIAAHAPAGRANEESVIRRFKRWLQHDHHTLDAWFLPVARALLASLAHQPLLFVMDGSMVGRGCIALMLSVVYHGRALPLVWLVIKGKKGHFPEQTHRDLVAAVASLVPQTADVTVMGDGEFDGTLLQADIHARGWKYVLRTSSNSTFCAYEMKRSASDLKLEQAEGWAVREAYVTGALYGPVTLMGIWEQGYDEPLYLVTNMADEQKAVAWYRKRAHIETFFRDHKSHGFHLHKSHLSDPKRLTRLLIASCLAYLWLVYLGVCALRDGWLSLLHRQDRCDISLFQLGRRLLARCLKDHLVIPEGFLVPPLLPDQPVRRWLKHAA